MFVWLARCHSAALALARTLSCFKQLLLQKGVLAKLQSNFGWVLVWQMAYMASLAQNGSNLLELKLRASVVLRFSSAL